MIKLIEDSTNIDLTPMNDEISKLLGINVKLDYTSLSEDSIIRSKDIANDNKMFSYLVDSAFIIAYTDKLSDDTIRYDIGMIYNTKLDKKYNKVFLMSAIYDKNTGKWKFEK